MCENPHIPAGDCPVEAHLLPTEGELCPVGDPTADVWSWKALHCNTHTHTPGGNAGKRCTASEADPPAAVTFSSVLSLLIVGCSVKLEVHWCVLRLILGSIQCCDHDDGDLTVFLR